MKALPCSTSRASGAGEQQRVLCFLCLQPGSELDNLEEILDDLQNSQLPQLFPESRPGAPAGSVDKQAIINDLMQLTSDSSPGTAVATQKPAMRISQSSESGSRMGRERVWSPKWGCRACGPAAGEERGSNSVFPVVVQWRSAICGHLALKRSRRLHLNRTVHLDPF